MIVIDHTGTGWARRRILVNPISGVCLESMNLIRMFEHRFDPVEPSDVASSYVSSDIFPVVKS
jgi:hypothetical protein